MAQIIDRRGQPLRDGHPFKGNRVISGITQPSGYSTNSQQGGSNSTSPPTSEQEAARAKWAADREEALQEAVKNRPGLTIEEAREMAEAFGF